MLKIADLTVKYGNFVALHGVKLNIEEREVVAIIGPNGAGKTTLLKTITGLLNPFSGTIEYKGRDLLGLASHERLEEGIAMAAEGHRIFPYMSVHENLLMGTYTYNTKERIKTLVERSYDFFPKLRSRKKQLAGTLSGGEQQMLAIGSAFASDPQLFLLDEPSMGLAPKINEEIVATLKDIRDQGMTILLSEQNAKVAMDLADRICILQSGQVIMEGTPHELADDPRVAEAYLAVY